MDLDLVALLRRIDPTDVSRILEKCRSALERSKASVEELQADIVQQLDGMTGEDRVIQLCKYSMYHAKYQFYRRAVSTLTDMVTSSTKPISSFQQMANLDDIVDASMALREVTLRDRGQAKSKKHSKSKRHRRRKGNGRDQSDGDSDDFDIV